MPQFVKKPVVIEARLLDGTEECATELAEWSSGFTSRRLLEPNQASELADSVSIPTLEGTMSASPGDYIICGVQGEFYPCKPDIFAATYDAI